VKVTALAGGVGGAKLLVGLKRALDDDGELTAVVNTGDDSTIYGLHVSPDVDIVTYWLAGRADYERGWGIAGDSSEVVDALARLGAEAWFRLGDRDMATCIYRTERLKDGATLSAVTDDIRRRLGIAARVIPMSDDPVRTIIDCADGRVLEFQEWFVRERCEPSVAEVRFAGMADAKPAPGVIDALEAADVIVICPSNPIVSIGPILSLPGVRAALRAHPRVVAVSPLVNGAPLKGPADKLMGAVGEDVSAAGVAAMYGDFCDAFVVDATETADERSITSPGMRGVKLDTLMTTHDVSERLARELLSL
jgi:LPPG:FO 2-phospho-L-lactate transferase